MTQTLTDTVPVRETLTGPRRLAGAMFLALSAQFMTAIMLAAAMAPDYDFGAGAISDLGVFPETALLFNGSLILVGILNVVGGVYFYRSHGKRWLLSLFVLAGVGAIGTGLVPLDVSDAHSLFALVAFLFFNLEAIGTATHFDGAMRGLSILAGGIGLVFLVLMAIGDAGTTAAFGPIGHGGTEPMIVYPAMIWLVAVGGYLLGTGDGTDR